MRTWQAKEMQTTGQIMQGLKVTRSPIYLRRKLHADTPISKRPARFQLSPTEPGSSRFRSGLSFCELLSTIG